MEIIAILVANILFLASACLGVWVERRVCALERAAVYAKEEQELVSRLEALEQLTRTAPESSGKPDANADERFTKGVENILSYALNLGAAQNKGGHIDETI